MIIDQNMMQARFHCWYKSNYSISRPMVGNHLYILWLMWKKWDQLIICGWSVFLTLGSIHPLTLSKHRYIRKLAMCWPSDSFKKYEKIKFWSILLSHGPGLKQSNKIAQIEHPLSWMHLEFPSKYLASFWNMWKS